jgi:hypothetical protein
LEDSDLDADFSVPSELLLSLFDSRFSVLLCSELCSLDSGSSRFILIGLKLRASSDMSMSSSLWLSCSAFCAAFALWKSMKIIAA